MSTGLKELVFLGALGFVIVAVGCSGEEGADTNVTNTTNNTADTDDHADGDHDHPSEGPHHGSLIEFGAHEYHGEFVHDADSVTIYILDSGATEAVPIEAESVTLNVTHDGEASQHMLEASPEAGEPDGHSSRFVLNDAALVELLDSKDTTAKVSVSIEGISYQGDLAHDHEGHDHAHSHE